MARNGSHYVSLLPNHYPKALRKLAKLADIDDHYRELDAAGQQAARASDLAKRRALEAELDGLLSVTYMLSFCVLPYLYNPKPSTLIISSTPPHSTTPPR